jgi:hypothetical protein
MVVKPIITYATTVWWPRVKYKTCRARLSKFQMLVCLRITGAMKTAPTTATEVLLGLPPLHLRPRQESVGSVAMNNEVQTYMAQACKKSPGHYERIHLTDEE